MSEQKELLTPNRKALTINLDEERYGTFAEIGAGQEVARVFFQAGGAAGTVAKTISAYDMTFSDAIYGKAPRYVSRERLAHMLDHEYDLLIERLDVFLGFPEIDPHGDPIPSADGHIRSIAAVPLTQITDFQHAWKVCAVTEDDTDFLRLLTRMGIALGTVLNIVEHHPFDDSYVVKMAPNATEILITSKVAHNLLLKKANR